MRALVLAAGAYALVACGNRAAIWDTPVDSQSKSFGLTKAVLLVDDQAHRAVALEPLVDQGLYTTSYAIGHGVATAAVSPDATRLFVLSAGDTPRRSATDELPSLTMLDASGLPITSVRYPMSEPLAGLAIDPERHYAVAFAGTSGSQASFVANPNQIVLFDLTRPPGPNNPTSRTIRSFGGQPQKLTFSPTLLLPAGPRRLLVIETDQDVTLLDLDHVFDATPHPEITVRLTSGADTTQVTPGVVAIDDGDPADPNDARVALQTSDSNVFTMELVAATDGGPNDFAPSINLTDVGGTPTDIAFVRTDSGLRVAALVPSTSSAVLVDPDTSITTTVALPAPYEHLSVVTDIVGAGTSSTAASLSPDIALLWSGTSYAAAGVAFWTLGTTVGQPYRSVEVIDVNGSISAVHDVPTPNDRLKVLELQTESGFYVLDLVARTAAPLSTMSAVSLAIAPDGLRMWAFASGSMELASIDLAQLEPVPLTTSAPIAAAFDVARADGGRSLVTIHAEGGMGATIFDALQPDTATSRRYSALLVGGQ